VGRAGAVDHPRPAVSSEQPRTATPQVNLPVRWQANRPDLAYNDEGRYLGHLAAGLLDDSGQGLNY
jgi:hypothetical protein